MNEDIVQSPSAFADDNIFDAFSAFDAVIGPDTLSRKAVQSGPYSNIFRLSTNSVLSAENDNTICVNNSGGGCSPDEPSPDGSWSDHSIEDILETERYKDSLRKYHALKELLATEFGYLMDLKALVTVCGGSSY